MYGDKSKWPFETILAVVAELPTSLNVKKMSWPFFAGRLAFLFLSRENIVLLI